MMYEDGMMQLGEEVASKFVSDAFWLKECWGWAVTAMMDYGGVGRYVLGLRVQSSSEYEASDAELSTGQKFSSTEDYTANYILKQFTSGSGPSIMNPLPI
jgi:hypothetical protein